MRSSFKEFAHSIKCVEVGVCRGDNALNMLTRFPYMTLYLVDSFDVNNTTFQFEGDKFSKEQRDAFIEKTKETLAKYNDRIEWIIKDSKEASEMFEDNSLDYVYIDAQHEYENVLRDLKSWYPKVRVGSVMAGHDLGCNGVNTAVKEYFGDYKNLGCDWLVRKGAKCQN